MANNYCSSNCYVYYFVHTMQYLNGAGILLDERFGPTRGGDEVTESSLRRC